jgi:flagellar basal-body rod protein FlgC
MSMVGAISAANSSLQWSMRDMAATADNIANMRTARSTDGPAFQGTHAIATENPDGGVFIDLTSAADEEGIVLSEPTHPEADAAGDVRYPSIDMGEELVRMQMAQRNVEVQTASIDAAVDTYRELLAMTNRDRERMTETSA